MMQLKHNIHLAYCTNIHRGESWNETFSALEKYTLRVKERVCPRDPYAIGLRLSDEASRELSDKSRLLEFQRWLETHNCYVFTINGFPFGRFHGTRVKEQVYLPDWTNTARVAYTNRLFDLLAEIVPPGIEGSVSTAPCSFKLFIKTQDQVAEMRRNLWSSIEHIAGVSARTGKKLHLGLEPEPLCYLETSEETVDFINQMRQNRPGDTRVDEFLGVNYDTCHLAVEYEKPEAALERFQRNNIKISKLHFSSALKVAPTEVNRKQLSAFVEPIYFHQVIALNKDGTLSRFTDLDEALNDRTAAQMDEPPEEWRIHFHIPLHCEPGHGFQSTQDHLLGVMDALAKNPRLCSHIEMETYTWEVLPPEIKRGDVVDQLTAEYEWTLKNLAARGLA
jgi:sugar phosphate isomerase/epimerase